MWRDEKGREDEGGVESVSGWLGKVLGKVDER